MKDLTCSLRVSKQWRKVILGSPKLRRILFLEPTKPSEWLGWEEEYGPRHIEDDNLPSYHLEITNAGGKSHQLIVETHLLLLQKPEHANCYGARLQIPPIHELENLTTSTLVCQPPLKRVVVYYWSSDAVKVHRAGGVTFGAVVKGAKKLKAKHDRAIAKHRSESNNADDSTDDGELDLLLCLPEAVVNEDCNVQSARSRLATCRAKMRHYITLASQHDHIA